MKILLRLRLAGKKFRYVRVGFKIQVWSAMVHGRTNVALSFTALTLVYEMERRIALCRRIE